MTYEEAIDEIFSVFRQMWKDPVNGPEAIVGYQPKVLWPGIQEPDKPEKDKFWARISQVTISDDQTAFCGDMDALFTNDGILIVNLFCPMSNNDGFTNGRKISTLIRDAYRSVKTPGGAWFRNPRIQELDPEAHFYRFNVIVEYEYDEKD